MSIQRARKLPPVWCVSCLPIFHFLFSIFFLALFCTRTAFALDPSLDISQYAHTAWRVRDGFVKGTINAIAQTPDGYLLLGTDFGLYRFDGIRAVLWQPPEGQQLPSDYIWSLLVSRDGTLWIGTKKGLASWKSGKLTTYPEVSGSVVSSLLQDREGTVWLTVHRPGRVCVIRGTEAHCDEVGRLGSYPVALFEDRKGNLWVLANGLWRWKPGSPKQYTFPRGIIDANALIENDSGTVLLATNDGLKQIVGEKIENYALPRVTTKFRPSQFFRSSDGALWVGTQMGLLHMHQGKTDLFTVAEGLSGDFISSIFEDREGNVWVGAQGGLDRFREYAVPRVSGNEGLSTNEAHSVQATRDGAVWIGTSSGLNRWQNGRVAVYRNGPFLGASREERALTISEAVTEIANSGLTGIPHSLGQDDQGRLWVSTSVGVFYFDGARFVRVLGLQRGAIMPGISGDGHGKVWISNDALGLFHLMSGNIVQPIPWSQFGQKSSGVQSLVPDRLDGLWLGFLEGGIVYFKGGKVGASYTTADGLGNGRVNDLRFGSLGALWAATEGGLSRIKEGRIATLSSKNGLPCDVVHWSIEDDDQFVWLYMTCGLVRIARSELDAWVSDPNHTVQASVFDASDGVKTIGEYGGYGPRVTKSPDGKIWFVTYDGVSVIDPQHLPYNKIPPPVHIEQLTADGKEYDTSSPGNGRGPLPPLIRDLTINYTALSLAVPEKVRFRVKLEGQDKDWRELTDRRAHYTNLRPKHYRFLVKACNNSGVWNEEGAFVDFAILPAYYQTNWFRTLVVAAVVALLWAIYRIRVGVLERRQQLLERHRGEITALNERLMKAQEEERSRIAGELHDGVLQKLTFLSLSLGAAKRQVPAELEAREKIGDVQKKLIDVGTDIRQLSHELHPVVLQESGLPEALASYCEDFAKAHGIPVSCETDKTVRDLSPGAALCIYRIAQEALGNVGKHSKANKVEVRLTRADGRVRLSVSDDGVGFASNRPGESGGLGLINMRERVRQLRGTLELESEPGRGTTVRAEVPFRPAP